MSELSDFIDRLQSKLNKSVMHYLTGFGIKKKNWKYTLIPK
jgi:hypothetical protein